MRSGVATVPGWARAAPESAAKTADQRLARWHSVTCGLGVAFTLAAFLKVGASDPLASIGGVQSVYEPVMLLLGTTVLLLRSGLNLPTRLLSRVPLLSLLAYSVYAMISSLWSPSLLLSLAKGFELMLVCLNGALAVQSIRQVRPSRTLYAIMAVAVLGVTASFMLLNVLDFGTPFNLQYTAYDGRTRLWLAYTHPIDTGDLVGLGLLCALLSDLSTRVRVVLLLLFGVLLAATAARASEIGVGAALVFWVVLRNRSGAGVGRRMLALGALLLIVGGVTAWIVATNDALVQLIPTEALTLDGRLGLWTTALDLSLKDVPSAVFGYGYFATRFVLLESFDWGGHTHQVFLEVLFTTGLIGLALFFAFAISSGRMAARGLGLVVMLPYFTVTSFDNPVLFQPSVEMVIATIVVANAAWQGFGATRTALAGSRSRQYLPHARASAWGR